MNKNSSTGRVQDSSQANQRSSELFVMRVWLEESDEGEEEFLGKIQHTTTGESRFFHSLSELRKVITEMMRPEQDTASDQTEAPH